MKYKIEETKGFTKTIGNYVVKHNGKGIQYFWTRAEADEFLLRSIGVEVVALDDPQGFRSAFSAIKTALGE